MATVESHQRAQGLKEELGPLSDKVEPKLVDDVRKDVLLTEGDSNSNESWCYWVPFPGVRYYCLGEQATTVRSVEQSRRGLPT